MAIMILTEQEILQIGMQDISLDAPYGYARAIESAVLEKLKAQEPVAWKAECTKAIVGDHAKKSSPTTYAAFNQPLYTHPDPRVAELEAVLRECLDALVHCEGVFDEVRGYPITYDLTIEAIAKIDEVLR